MLTCWHRKSLGHTVKPILVLDDDEDLLLLLRRLLEHDRFRVVTATRGKQALEHIAEEMPCLIISDLMLPDMDGEDFLVAFRERWPEANVPTILLTASAIRAEVAKRVGVTTSLEKPFDAGELTELARSLCGEEHRRRPK